MSQHRSSVQAISLKIEDLLSHILAGKVRVPKFQRPLQWKREDNRLLFDSILRGYPVGSLLFWKREASAEPIRIGTFSMTGPEQRDAWLVVDGQQRITALAGALLGKHPRPPEFDFYVDPSDGTVGAGVGARTTGIPLAVLANTESLIPYLHAHSEIDIAAASTLSKRLREYPLPVTVLETEDENFVRDVFKRLNSSGKPLKQKDVFQALHVGRPSMQAVEAAQSVGPELRFGALELDPLIRAFKGIAGKDPLGEWQPDAQGIPAAQKAAFVRGTREAVQFLKEVAHVPTSSMMPYSLPLGVLVYYFARHPETAPRNRTLLSYWFWRGVLGHRFAGDFTSVRRFFKAVEAPEDEAVQSLLATVEIPTAAPDVRKVPTLGHADGKVVGLVMIAAQPRDARTGQSLDASTVLLDRDPGDAFVPLFKGEEHPLAKTLTNRVFHPKLNSGALLRALEDGDVETRHSHLLHMKTLSPAVAVLEQRANDLQRAVTDFTDRALGRFDSQRPPLAHLLEDTE